MGRLSIRTWDVVGPNCIFVVQIGWVLHDECWGGGGGGAIPAKLYTLLRAVGIRHPVIRRHASFRAESIFAP